MGCDERRSGCKLAGVVRQAEERPVCFALERVEQKRRAVGRTALAAMVSLAARAAMRMIAAKHPRAIAVHIDFTFDGVKS